MSELLEEITSRLPISNNQILQDLPDPRQLDDEDHEVQVDAMLSKEMNQLSVTQREKVYEDIHGVEEVIKETPEFVEEKLRALEYELQQIVDKPAYDMAIEQQMQQRQHRHPQQPSSDYVTSRKFRLMFLRAEEFHVHKAVKRLVLFMEGKLDLFGPHVLNRPVFFSDLDKEDRACLQAGCMQMLPVRDKSGRAIIGDFQHLCPRQPIRSMLRTFYYVIQSAAEDAETQRRGVVGVLYYMGSKPKGDLVSDFELHSTGPKMTLWLPIRFRGLHLCSDDVKIRILKTLIVPTMGAANRARLRIHTGTHTEVQYSLMSFGVPIHSLPVTLSGELKSTVHSKWLSRRKLRDCLSVENVGENTSTSLSYEKTDLPGIHDVLLGRGKGGQNHDGNGRLRHVVSRVMNGLVDDFSGSGKGRMISKQIIDYIHKSSGGRFLKKNSKGWYELAPEDEAISKVLHTFRTERQARSKGTWEQETFDVTMAESTTTDGESINIHTLLDQLTMAQTFSYKGTPTTSSPPTSFSSFSSARSNMVNGNSKRMKTFHDVPMGPKSSDFGNSCFSLCRGSIMGT